ncbi:LLM class flavin-dependent oxidoreductase [Gluconobacter kondonii]|uniref:LLM class flavin-dependent oxidoreductase n=1 Tax=Gluconobacter kondonii TaxID=941463 RepID=UPI001B8D0B97|nr:LLM class flavin-dependent oxidoreductase [Gluconobacter kondonii]MBS1055092.1 LLM class flavin-dependent oxidoreductase [Gluconobacter kondonii]MBS1058378.1 LLM class flavin-dependent oxidoreductase [Gluconobacter kondonii]MBS1079046.1 LLM class flavin-dependent oxidoreductase [Gluconobacter kondonii]
MIPLSILDLAFITEGSSATEALHRSADLAQHAESLGFKRFWLAEHHSMAGIASAATAVVIGYVAGATKTIRVGAGGIMLPNHAPLAVAEAFGTLESLYPGRIDLGLGRAPGSDQATMRALRRDPASADRFPQDVFELLRYFEKPEQGQAVFAVPGAGLTIPVWLLGSSLFSAHLAAIMGLPFAFASHFAPDLMEEALALYRERFEPSERLQSPYAMLSINAVIGETQTEAQQAATSLQQHFVALRQGRPSTFPAPRSVCWNSQEQRLLDSTLRYTFAGTAEDVTKNISAFVERYRPDELLIGTPLYSQEARRRTLSGIARHLMEK